MTKQVLNELNTICDEIMLQIVAPACGMSDVKADYFMSNISTYVHDDYEISIKILSEIQEAYGLTDEEMVAIDEYTNFIQLALIIWLGKDRPKYAEIY